MLGSSVPWDKGWERLLQGMILNLISKFLSNEVKVERCFRQGNSMWEGLEARQCTEHQRFHEPWQSEERSAGEGKERRSNNWSSQESAYHLRTAGAEFGKAQNVSRSAFWLQSGEWIPRCLWLRPT